MGQRKGIGGHQSPNGGKTNEWYTPPEIFEALGLHFDLDPCSPLNGPMPWVPAETFYTRRENGLMQEWHGKVWLNPPYGPETRHWMQKLAHHGNGVALLFARTDTRWFHESGVKADAICFVAGRPHFFTAAGQRAPHNSGAPVMLLGYGDECAQAVRECGIGCIVNVQREVSHEHAEVFDAPLFFPAPTDVLTDLLELQRNQVSLHRLNHPSLRDLMKIETQNR